MGDRVGVEMGTGPYIRARNQECYFGFVIDEDSKGGGPCRVKDEGDTAARGKWCGAWGVQLAASFSSSTLSGERKAHWKYLSGKAKPQLRKSVSVEVRAEVATLQKEVEGLRQANLRAGIWSLKVCFFSA